MDEKLFHVFKDGKSGFINDRGQVVIDFEFDGASSFSEGLARIFINGKTGFIDTKGNIKIEPRFDSAHGFSDGKAIIEIGDKEGYIDKDGNIVIKPQFYNCRDFENGLALVFIDNTSSGCFINNSGKIIIDNKNFVVSKFKEGLINCSDNNDNWGFIDINNNFVIPPIYKYAREFSEGKAAVVPPKNILGKPMRKNLFGFINKENELIIPPIFEGADIHFSEGLCAVWNKGYGYINERGEQVIPCELELGQHFSEGLAVFKPKGKNSKYGYIDKHGSVAINATYTIAEDFIDGLATVIIGKEFDDFKYGYINKSGEYVWEPSK